MASLQENFGVQFPPETPVWLHNLIREQKDLTSKIIWGGVCVCARVCVLQMVQINAVACISVCRGQDEEWSNAPDTMGHKKLGKVVGLQRRG